MPPACMLLGCWFVRGVCVVLTVCAIRTVGAGTTFRLIDLAAGGTRLFDVRGDGRTTVSSGGMNVTAGGVTVLNGGLVVSACVFDLFSRTSRGRGRSNHWA